MINFKPWFKTTVLTLCAATSFAALYFPAAASAAGETFSWNNTNIVGSGGLFTNNLTPQTVTFIKSGDNYIGSQMSRIETTSGCTYTISGLNAAGNSATISTKPFTNTQRNPCTVSLSGTVGISGNPPTGTTTAAQTSDDLCDNLGPNPLNFVVCPVIQTVADAAQRLDCTVLMILIVDTDPIFGGGQGTLDDNPTLGQCLGGGASETSTTEENAQKEGNVQSSAAFRKAWGVFRNIAYALLLIFGLIMVISQIMGLEIFDAYTIKKMLPKLIVAVIFVSLSWNIMNFLFNLSNDAAFAIMDLIKAPFKNIDAGIGTGPGDMALLYLIPIILSTAAVVGVGLLALLGVGGIVALIISVLLAIFSAFLLLAARNVVAYLLIMAAPLAIMCYAFEPFKKLFSLWRGLLVTILLSIPLVAAVIQTSHVGALVAYIANSGPSTLTAVAILIGGYAMIWAIFKKIDQIAGQLGNIVSGVTGKLQKGLSDYRRNAIKRRAGEVISNERNLFGNRSATGRVLSTAARDIFRRAHLANKPGAGWHGQGYRAGVLALEREHAKKMAERGADGSGGNDDFNEMMVSDNPQNEKEAIEMLLARRRAVAARRGKTWDAQKERRQAEIEVYNARADYGAPIGSNTMRAAAYRNAITSSTIFNDRLHPDETEPYEVRLKDIYERMARMDASMINSGLMTSVDIASAKKKASQRADIFANSFAKMMSQAEKSAERQRNGAAELITEQEISEWVSTTNENTNAGQRIAYRPETIEIQGRAQVGNLNDALRQRQADIERFAQERARLETQLRQAELDFQQATAGGRGVAPDRYDALQSRVQVARQDLLRQQSEVDAALGAGNSDPKQDLIRQFAALSAEQATLASYSTPDNARRFVNGVLGSDQIAANARTLGVALGIGDSPTPHQIIEWLRANSHAFSMYERNYSQSYASAAQATIASQQQAAAQQGVGGTPPPPVTR